MIAKLSIFLVLGVFLLSGCVQPAPINVDRSNYTTGALSLTFTDIGIRVSYPDTWTTEEFLGETRLLPKEEQKDSIPTVFSVSAENWTGSLDDYTTQYLENLPLADESSIETSSTTVAGLPAKQVTFNGNDYASGRKFVHTLFVKNGKAYSVAFGAKEDKFSTYSADFQSVLDSLEFV